MAKIAILIEKMYEDAELQYPRLRLKEAGHEVAVIGPKANEIYVGSRRQLVPFGNLSQCRDFFSKSKTQTHSRLKDAAPFSFSSTET